MTAYTIMTNVGRNKEAAALANGAALAITHIAWGDGSREPGGGETALVNEQGRKAVQGTGVRDGALNTAWFEVAIEADEGPYIIREAGLFDADNDLIAVATYPQPVNKPLNSIVAVLVMNVVFSDLENLVLNVSHEHTYVPAISRQTTLAGASVTIADGVSIWDESGKTHRRVDVDELAERMQQIANPMHAFVGRVVAAGKQVRSSDGALMENQSSASITLTGHTRSSLSADGLVDWFDQDDPLPQYLLKDISEDLSRRTFQSQLGTPSQSGWVKLARLDPSDSASDIQVILAVMLGRVSHPASVNVTVQVRQNAPGTAREVFIGVTSHTARTTIGAGDFVVTGDGYGTDLELWLYKGTGGGVALVQQLAYYGSLASEVYYDGDGAWLVDLPASTEVFRPTYVGDFPIGGLQPMYGNLVPVGFVKLNGTTLSRTSFPLLWDFAQVCGAYDATGADPHLFGPGDGLTTFTVPDIRGLHPRAWDDGRGIDAGRSVGSYQADQIAAHTHDIAFSTATHEFQTDGTHVSTIGSGSSTASTGSFGGTENRVKSFAPMYAIRAY